MTRPIGTPGGLRWCQRRCTRNTVPITIADPADPKRTRTLNGIAQMAEEHNNVRIWGGIHFRNSLVVATEMGRKIAAYMVENAIEPTR